MSRAAAAVALAVAALATACAPTLSARSVPPPGRSARLDEVRGFWGIKSYRMELSEGVALAFACTQGGPCEKMTVTSDDPSIAEVRPASLSSLEPNGFYNQAAPAAAVVVGKAAGTTHLHVRTRHGGRDIAVRIVPPPSPPPLRAAAH